MLHYWSNFSLKKKEKEKRCIGERDKWREANVQLFLIESAQRGSRTVLLSGLDQDHLWCWQKKGSSSAGVLREHFSISLKMSKTV